VTPKRTKAKAQVTRDPLRVFISHATGDKWVARTICEQIDAVPGASSFRDDRDIGGGEPIPSVIRNEIRAADELLVLLTPSSQTRIWVGMEIGMAFLLNKPIVPIWYNVPVTSFSFLATYRGHLLNDFPEYLEALRARVRRSRS
jgi:TIR domain